jgi:hypothetical protein
MTSVPGSSGRTACSAANALPASRRTSSSGRDDERERDAAGPRQPAIAHQLSSLGLLEIAPPPTSDSPAASEAATLAFSEVERAADALGLPAARIYAVCRAAEAGTEGAERCHRFVGTSYRRLRRTCLAGEVAVRGGRHGLKRGGGGGGP